VKEGVIKQESRRAAGLLINNSKIT